MSWFDEQLKYRKQKDDENFADAIESIASAVMGKRLTEALNEKEIAQSAIGEILKFFHLKNKVTEIPDGIGSVEEQLEFCLRPVGVMHRKVCLDKGWYKCALGPMLGTLRESGTAVALIPGRVFGYKYVDFETGKVVKLNRRTEQLLDTEAECFYKPLPMKALTVRDLMHFMIEQLSLSDIILYVGLMLLASLLGLMSPKLTKLLFSTVLESGSVSILAALAGFMICFSVTRICFSAFQTLITARIGIKQDIAVQAAVMNRMMSLPVSFFRGYSSGELSQRSAYVQNLCNIMFQSIGVTGLTSLFSLIYLWQIFSFAPSLVVPSLIITVLTLALSMITTFMQMRITKEKMLLSAKTYGMTYSMITGVQKIKLAGAEKRMFSRWARSYAENAALEYNPPVFLKLSETLSLVISLVGTMVLYYIAVRNSVSPADYLAFNDAYGMVSGAFMAFASIAMTIADIKPTLEMAKPIMEAEPETSEGREPVVSLKGNVQLSNVSFRYSDDEPLVIDDLSLKIRAGEYVAVVGSTGCGKSTLIRLLLGFEKPQKGSIFYDEKDISRVDIHSLRRKIGVVMQDGKLFLGDIYSNIVISAPQLSMNEAWEAARIAAVDEDIRSMPMGMHTVISEGQGGISGGQRQRLLIARAVAPKPKILIFDEATSALDNVTQKKVSDAIDSLRCTRIVIAHRLSTIRHCDRIIVLDKGRIAEEGTYEELIANNGFFAELVKRQRLDIEE